MTISDIYKNPRGGWSPHYIVVDEDIFSVKEDYKIRIDTKRFPSVIKIILAVQSGITLQDAIMANQADIFTEALKNQEHQLRFLDTTDYLKKINTPIKSELKFSELFKNIYLYAKHEEEHYLEGMRVGEIRLFKNKKFSRAIPALLQSVIKAVAYRYRNTPTIFLDATANQSIVEKLLPNVEYHSVNVKSQDTINLIQLQNFAFSKSQLQALKAKELSDTVDVKKRKGTRALDDVFFGLKKLAEKYTLLGKTVGVISYKNIPEITEGTGFDTFPAFLAHKMGASLYAHFGNVRGSNKFDQVDCLIILGRYCLAPKPFESNSWAIFNEPACSSEEYRDSVVRMKDGSIKLLNSSIIINDESRAISEHYSLSETKQAIGRGRMVHGKAKDIYYLSNEYIGSEIEVTDFVSYDDLFLRLIDNECLETLNKKGFLQDRQGVVMDALGISRDSYIANKQHIINEFKEAGFSYSEVTYFKADSKQVTSLYFIKDQSLLLDYLEPNLKKPIAIVSMA